MSARKYIPLTIIMALLVVVVPLVGLAKNEDAADKNAARKEAAAQKKQQASDNKDERAALRATAQEERVADREVKKEERETARQEKFCEKTDENVSKIESRVVDGKNRVIERFDRHIEKAKEHKAQKFETVQKQRAEADAKRVTYYTELRARATTDEQKSAVAAFEGEVEAAVTVRRAAVDSAVNTFWDQTVALTIARRDAYSATYDSFIAEVAEIVVAAKTDCTTADSAKDVAKDVRSALKTAQQQFKSDRAEATSLKKDIIVLRAQLRESVKAAADVYRDAVAAARTTLQGAFGSTSIETDEAPADDGASDDYEIQKGDDDQ